jgi:hypothetical protein
MESRQLMEFQGKTVQIGFPDGQRVIAKIISVDSGSPGTEVVYDVKEVLEWGKVDPRQVDPKAVAAASADEIVEMTAWTKK